MFLLKFIGISIIIVAVCVNYVPVDEKTEYSEEIEFMEYKEKIYNLVDNKSAADSLIKTLYTDEEIETIYGCMRLQNNKAECIRQNKEYVYTVNKSEDGYYLFNIYNFDEHEDWEIDRWYCKRKFTLTDFTNHVKKGTFFEDVEKFDPFLENSGASGVASFIHHTIDGYKIIVCYYPNKNGKLFVGDIQILGGKDNPIYYNMLDIDKELLKK